MLVTQTVGSGGLLYNVEGPFELLTIVHCKLIALKMCAVWKDSVNI